jgi:hypothetical protein
MPAGNDVLSNYRCLEKDEAGQSNSRDCYREAYGLTMIHLLAKALRFEKAWCGDLPELLRASCSNCCSVEGGSFGAMHDHRQSAGEPHLGLAHAGAPGGSAQLVSCETALERLGQYDVGGTAECRAQRTIADVAIRAA